MKDGVYSEQFCGAPAFKVVWQGKELDMVWGKETDADRHLWLLQHPGAVDVILNMDAVRNDSAVRVADVWNTPRCRQVRAQIERGKTHG